VVASSRLQLPAGLVGSWGIFGVLSLHGSRQRRCASRAVLAAAHPVNSILKVGMASIFTGLVIVQLGLGEFVGSILLRSVSSRLVQGRGRTRARLFQVHDRPATEKEKETPRERPDVATGRHEVDGRKNLVLSQASRGAKAT